MITDIKKYYSQRVNVYDKSMYFKDEPIRKSEIAEMTKLITKLFKEKKVLEVACGTGYWTQIISKVAKEILATDLVEEVIEEAKKKKYECLVKFEINDALDLKVDNKFNAGFAGFWFSHMLKSDLSKFLEEFHKNLEPGSIVFLSDNVKEDDPYEDSLITEGENTFRARNLDGQEFKVIKNYFNEVEFKKYFSPFAKDSNINIHIGKWAWWVWYETK